MINRKAILILLLLGVAQIPTLNHDNLDGFVADEHIDWTGASDDFKTSGTFYLTKTDIPSSESDSGTTGEVVFDSNWMYRCVATNTWKRAALSSWAVTDVLLLSDGSSKLLLSDGASFLLIRI